MFLIPSFAVETHASLSYLLFVHCEFYYIILIHFTEIFFIHASGGIIFTVFIWFVSNIIFPSFVTDAVFA